MFFPDTGGSEEASVPDRRAANAFEPELATVAAGSEGEEEEELSGDEGDGTNRVDVAVAAAAVEVASENPEEGTGGLVGPVCMSKEEPVPTSAGPGEATAAVVTPEGDRTFARLLAAVKAGGKIKQDEADEAGEVDDGLQEESLIGEEFAPDVEADDSTEGSGGGRAIDGDEKRRSSVIIIDSSVRKKRSGSISSSVSSDSSSIGVYEDDVDDGGCDVSG